MYLFEYNSTQMGCARVDNSDIERSVLALVISTQNIAALPPLTQMVARKLIEQKLVVQDPRGVWRMAMPTHQTMPTHAHA